jgi:hypothetical protein
MIMSHCHGLKLGVYREVGDVSKTVRVGVGARRTHLRMEDAVTREPEEDDGKTVHEDCSGYIRRVQKKGQPREKTYTNTRRVGSAPRGCKTSR